MSPATVARPSYMPKSWPNEAGMLLYLEGQQDAYSATIRDISGQGNHGTIGGATWERNDQGVWVLDFDGSDDKVDCAKISVASGFTCLIWFRRDGDSGGGAADNFHLLISRLNGASNEKNRLFVAKNGTSFLANVWVDGAQKQTAGHNITDTTEYNQVGFRWDGSNVRTILNGVFGANTAAAGTLDSGAATTLIGYYSTTVYITNGPMAFIRVTSTVLSAVQCLGIFRRERHLFGR